MARYKTIIGRYELIQFPEYLLGEVPAKIDTGAHLSTVHAGDVKEVKKGDKTVLRATLLAAHASYPYSREVEFEEYSSTVIANSFGQKEERYVVMIKVKVANKVFKAKFTLADRSKKPFPILLGRHMLNGRFIVDSSVSNIKRSVLEKTMPKVLNEDTDED